MKKCQLLQVLFKLIQLMLHHISTPQLGLKNSHQQLVSLNPKINKLMLLHISMNQPGPKNSHLPQVFQRNKVKHSTTNQLSMKECQQEQDSLNKNQLMHPHISTNQPGLKNSHLLQVFNKNKAHHSSMNQLSMIECQQEQDLLNKNNLMHPNISTPQPGLKNSHQLLDFNNNKDLQDLENQPIMKECHHLLDSFNFQFANQLTLKELHALLQIKNYLLLV
jgi:hypothetical protein